jgi:hypothetical protein
MQTACVPGTSGSNGIKRSAASAQLSDTHAHSLQATTTNTNLNSGKMNNNLSFNNSISPPPPEKRSYIVVESPLKLDTIESAVN